MASFAAVDTNHFRFPVPHPLSAISDEELVALSIRADEDAFRQLYERYRRRVYNTVCRIVRDREEAQDVMQEIFVKVYRALAHWDPQRARFSTWLYRLAANHAIDHWRTSRRRAESPLEDTRVSAESGSLGKCRSCRAAYYPEGLFDRRERIAEIRRCVDDLPPLQRRVFLLRHFQGFQLHEIAESEGHKLSTVKTSLYRATHLLRRRLRALYSLSNKNLIMAT